MNGLKYGFIGVGSMGGPMALRLWNMNFPLTAFDTDPKIRVVLSDQGLPFADTIEALAQSCDIIFTCLPTPAICGKVSDQIARAPQRRCRIQAEMSTVGVNAIVAARDALAARGITLLDAPISGGPRAVPEGKLTCLVSGPAEAVALVRPALEALAGQVFVLGNEAGAAQAMKLGNNLLAACNLAATSEVLAMLVRAGIAEDQAIAIINVSTGRNRASELLFPAQILTGSYAQGARLDILAKDTALAAEAATHFEAELPLGKAIGQAWLDAADAGFGHDDITAIYRFMTARNHKTTSQGSDAV